MRPGTHFQSNPTRGLRARPESCCPTVRPGVPILPSPSSRRSACVLETWRSYARGRPTPSAVASRLPPRCARSPEKGLAAGLEPSGRGQTPSRPHPATSQLKKRRRPMIIGTSPRTTRAAFTARSTPRGSTSTALCSRSRRRARRSRLGQSHRPMLRDRSGLEQDRRIRRLPVGQDRQPGVRRADQRHDEAQGVRRGPLRAALDPSEGPERSRLILTRPAPLRRGRSLHLKPNRKEPI